MTTTGLIDEMVERGALGALNSERATYGLTPVSELAAIQDGNPYRAMARACLTAALDGMCVVPREPTFNYPFDVGARVFHISRRQEGTVVAISEDGMKVEFPNSSFGLFDRRWFETRGELLQATTPASSKGE